MPYKDKNKRREYNRRPEVRKVKEEYMKKYIQKNKDKIREQRKKYRQENKEKIRLQKKADYQKNKESILEKKKGYYRKNIERIKQRNKEYYQNPEIQEKKKEYERKHSERRNKRQRERLKNDKAWATKQYVRRCSVRKYPLRSCIVCDAMEYKPQSELQHHHYIEPYEIDKVISVCKFHHKLIHEGIIVYK